MRSVSDRLINAARQDVKASQQKITVAYRLAVFLIAAVTVAGLGLAGVIARILNTNITRRILRLTHVAEQLKDGHRGARAHEGDPDELGQLGRAFNFMAGRLHRIVNNLEDEVSRRTSQLKAANAHLKKEIRERRQAEERFRLAAEAMSDLIYEWDIEKDILIWYGDIDAALGYEPGTFPGSIEAWMARIHPDDMITIKAAVERHRTAIQPIDYEYRIRKRDGSWRYWFDYGVPVLTDQGRPYKWVGICTDITEKKQNEGEKRKLEGQLRQSHKMEAIGTLAGGIAHDFNNILGIIIGNAELALDETPEWQSSRVYIDEIKTASLRAKDVVLQLLSFSRKTEQLQRPLDISPVVNENLKLLRSSIPSNIEIQSHIPASCDTILADATQIHQVLINVCTNAAHAMSENGGILEIHVNAVASDRYNDNPLIDVPSGTYLEIKISDTGTGIDEKYREKIFDPYFTTKEIGKGTGMGLAVVHGIVKNQNGHIFVESRSGKGTTITILFPVVPGQPRQETAPIQKQETRQGNETILFVDDESALADIAKRTLEGKGYAVSVKTDPLEALSAFEKDPGRFDLVISDMTMPGMNGLELSDRLRHCRDDIAIIICTGNRSLIDKEKAETMGISALVMKPVTMAEMSRLVRKVLDG